MPTIRETTAKTRVPNTLEPSNRSVAAAAADRVISKIVPAASHGNTIDDQVEELKARSGHGAATEYATQTDYAIGDEVYWRDGDGVLHFYYRLAAGQDAAGSNPSTASTVWREAVNSLSDVPVIGPNQNTVAAIMQRRTDGQIDFNTQLAVDLAAAQTAAEVQAAIDAQFERATRTTNWQGAWRSGHTYAVGQYVVDRNILYRRRTAGQDADDSERPASNAGDWFRITGTEVHYVQFLRDVIEAHQSRIALVPAQANRGQIIQRQPHTEGYVFTDPLMRWRGAWTNTNGYYFNDVVTHLGRLWVLTGANHLTAVASGNGTIPGTFAPWAEMAVTADHTAPWAEDGNEDPIPGDKLPPVTLESLESSPTIAHDEAESDFDLRSPGTDAIWSSPRSGARLDTGLVEGRHMRDRESFDHSDPTSHRYTAGFQNRDNARGRIYTYFLDPQGDATGDGWRIDPNQGRAYNNGRSTDIVITEDGTKLRGAYHANVNFTDQTVHPSDPDRLTVSLYLDNGDDDNPTPLAQAPVVYDLSRHIGTISLGSLARNQTFANFGEPPATLQGFFDRFGTPLYIGRATGARYMQATVTCQVTGDPGPMRCIVFTNDHAEVDFAGGNTKNSERDVDTHLVGDGSPTPQNPHTFTFENCFPTTDGRYPYFMVRFVSRTGAEINPTVITSIAVRLETLAVDESGKQVNLVFPERTYSNGNRLWIGVVSENQPEIRAVGFTNQVLTLSNADNTVGRTIADTAGRSTAPYAHVAFSGTQTNWWRFDGGILEARRDMRQARINVTVPTLARSNRVTLWRERNDEVSRENLGDRIIPATQGGTIGVSVRAVRAGDRFRVVLETPVTASGWGIEGEAQTTEGLPARQVHSSGILATEDVLNEVRPNHGDQWTRMNTVDSFRWADQKVLYVAINTDYNRWEVASVHTRLLQAITALDPGRVNSARRATTDHFVELSRGASNYVQSFIAPIEDGDIAIAIPADAHRVRIWAE